MVEFELTQKEVDDLISIRERSLAEVPVIFSVFGRVKVALCDMSVNIDFQLGMRRTRPNVKKGTNQTRLRQTIVLLGLDYRGALHWNPDGEETPCPHIHIYQSRCKGKWALPISNRGFKNSSDFGKHLYDLWLFVTSWIDLNLKVLCFDDGRN